MSREPGMVAAVGERGVAPGERRDHTCVMAEPKRQRKTVKRRIEDLAAVLEESVVYADDPDELSDAPEFEEGVALLLNPRVKPATVLELAGMDDVWIACMAHEAAARREDMPTGLTQKAVSWLAGAGPLEVCFLLRLLGTRAHRPVVSEALAQCDEDWLTPSVVRERRRLRAGAHRGRRGARSRLARPRPRARGRTGDERPRRRARRRAAPGVVRPLRPVAALLPRLDVLHDVRAGGATRGTGAAAHGAEGSRGGGDRRRGYRPPLGRPRRRTGRRQVEAGEGSAA